MLAPPEVELNELEPSMVTYSAALTICEKARRPRVSGLKGFHRIANRFVTGFTEGIDELF